MVVEWEGMGGNGREKQEKVKKKCYDAIRVVDDVGNSRRGY